MNLLIIIGLLLALALLLRWFLRASPRRVARLLRTASAWFLLLGGVALALRGLGAVGVPMALLGLSLLRAAWWPAGQEGGGQAGGAPSPQPDGMMTPQQARDILGVGPGATEEEINAAYRRLMKKLHPDAGGSEGLARQLNQAREVLLEELQR